MANKAGERGKASEKQVSAALSTFDGRQDTTWWRVPDARAGSLQPALADFLLLHRQHLILIEVKEVAHAFRLPFHNFDVGQVARMRRFKLAGAHSFVLTYFKPLKKWRCVEIDWFTVRPEGASWDFREFPAVDLKEILNAGNGITAELVTPLKV